LYKVLTVVTEKLKHGNHGKTSVLQFLELTLLEFFLVEVELSGIEVTKESPVVNGSDEEEDLSPAEGWDGVEPSPGIAFSDVPNGLAALNAIPALGWAQIFFLIGAVDYWGFLGDFDAGKLNLDEEELEKRQLQELQHGRLAMIAMLELFRHDSQNLVQPGFDGMDKLITGLPFIY
jgi:hypothetical protein